MSINQTNTFHFQSLIKILYFLGQRHFLSFVILEGKMVLIAYYLFYLVLLTLVKAIVFLNHIVRAGRNALKLYRPSSHQSVPCKMHQHCMSVYNEFLHEYRRKSLSVMVNNELHRNYQTNVQKIRNALTPPLVGTS